MKKLRLYLPIFFTIFLIKACGGGNGDMPGDMQDQQTDQEAAQSRIDIRGAGATFPAPLITAMADDYRDLTDRRVTVNYQSIGSGGGIRQFMEQTVMFGMSEAFLSDEVMADIESKTDGKAFNLPITLADVVPTYNLPEVEDYLVFSGELLVDIYLGNITRWNDPKIAEWNPDVDLPDRSITVVHRSDGSGTTNLWTNYLSRVSDEWRDRVGYSTSVSWPEGVGANGNEGVAGTVQSSPGAIGYNSLSYALLNDMSYGSVKNKAGNVIRPSFEATTAAADIELPEDTRILFTDTDAEDGYPIAGFAWMLLYENLDENSAIRNRNAAKELIEFVVWAITDGQELSEDLGFARIPEVVLELNLEMIRQLKWNGEKLGEEVLLNMDEDLISEIVNVK